MTKLSEVFPETSVSPAAEVRDTKATNNRSTPTSTMRIIEQTTIGKKSAATCEDTIVATADYIAVIDGSTSKTSMRIDPQYTNGQLCAMTTARCIETMAADMTCEQFCLTVTERTAALYDPRQKAAMARKPHLRSTASAIVYSRYRNEIWMIGDCQCIVDGQLYTNEKPEERHIAHERARFIREAINRQLYTPDELARHDYGRDHIHDRLVEATRGQNRDFAVIDGFSIPLRHIRIIPGGREMVLASDGYPYLYGTLDESERRLARLMADDPLCIDLYQATKGRMYGYNSFDDRSYIRFER